MPAHIGPPNPQPTSASTVPRRCSLIIVVDGTTGETLLISEREVPY